MPIIAQQRPERNYKMTITLPDLEERKSYIRKQLLSYVESITKRDPKWKQFYLCVFDECKSREHTHSTGGAFSVYGKGKEKWKCQSCGHGGDIFDLIGYMYGYKSGKDDKQTLANEFKQEYAKACELFQVENDFTPQQPETPQAEPEAATDSATPAADLGEQDTQPATEGQFKDYLEGCISACTEGSEGYNYLISRGFTEETIQHCMLGYDPEASCITIPYDKSYSYYTSRYIGNPPDGLSKYYKPEGIPAPVYNETALYSDNCCFVCEGPLDAISIIQAGGKAVALGGVTSQGKFIGLLKDKRPSRCLILSFDEDGAGKEGQHKLAARLEEIGVPFVNAKYSLDKYKGAHHDANELLLSNPEQLREDIAANIAAAKDYGLEYDLETGNGLYSVVNYKNLFRKHQTTVKQRISTGFKSLDIALYGGFTNELYVLSAETSIGKSAISCCLAQNIAASGIDVLYYALEMGRDEFIARGASMISREINKAPIPYGDILNYTWDESIQDFYRKPFESYEPYVDEYMRRYGEHLYYIEGGFYGKTALEIAETAEQFKREHHIKQLVIVVDYLQRLNGDPNDKSQRDVMSITSAAVQILGNLASQKHNTVIAISSISNAQKGQRVTDAAGKYSGDIGYTAGILLGWNWHGYTDTGKEEEKEATAKTCKERGYREMILEVLKQRSGERDKKVTMFYYPQYNYFTSATAANAQPYKGKGGKK